MTQFRQEVQPADVDAVREIVTSTGFFYDSEIAIAVELVEENLKKGAQASGYHFLFADGPEGAIGYSCFGPIEGTLYSYDLYWVAVHQNHRGHGLGGQLMRASEEKIAEMGGRRVYVETSSRPLYEPTRRFYQKQNYRLEGELADFYGPGDGKQFWVKVLEEVRRWG